MTESFDVALMHPALRSLRERFSPVDEDRSEYSTSFWGGDLDDAIFVHASVDTAADVVRLRFELPSDTEEAVVGWVEAQPEPGSGVLQHLERDGIWCPRLVFQRSAQIRDWSQDPLFEEVEIFKRSWMEDLPVPERVDETHPFMAVDDPRDRPPENAWILMGSTPSYLGASELNQARYEDARGIYSTLWTVPRQISSGDVVLIYFTHPMKVVAFVARAASEAFFASDIEVNADRTVGRTQWWGYLSCPVEIDPISLQQLRRAHGDNLILRGRSGHYLRPEVIKRLPWLAADPRQQADVDRVVELPRGSADRPIGRHFDIETWRRFAAGQIVRERQVTDWLLLPLLRHLLPPDCRLDEEHRLPAGVGVADLVIERHGRAVHVIEVKQKIRKIAGSDWTESPDFQQVRRYASNLDVPSTLFDAREIIGFDRTGVEVLRIARREASNADLDRLRSHLFGGPKT